MHHCTPLLTTAATTTAPPSPPPIHTRTHRHDSDSSNDYVRFAVAARVTTAAANVAGVSLAVVAAVVYVVFLQHLPV